MLPPSPVDELMRDGWGAGGETAPEPVGVPPHTPDAPASVTVPRPQSPQPPSSNTTPPKTEVAVVKKDTAKQPLRISIPLADPVPAPAAPAPAQLNAYGTPLALKAGSDSPALSVSGSAPARVSSSASLGFDAKHTPSISGSLGVSGRVEVGASLDATTQTDNPVPRLHPHASSLPGTGPSGSPGLAVHQGDVPSVPKSASVPLGLLSAQPGAELKATDVSLAPDAAKPSQTVVAPAAPLLGVPPAAGLVTSGTTATPEIEVSLKKAKVSGASQKPQAPATVELYADSVQAKSGHSASVLSVEPNQRVVGAEVLPGTARLADLPAGTPQSERASESAINSAAFDPSSEATATDRRQTDRQAQEEERRSHGSSLRRWLQDHFPFFF